MTLAVMGIWILGMAIWCGVFWRRAKENQGQVDGGLFSVAACFLAPLWPLIVALIPVALLFGLFQAFFGRID